MYAAIKPKSTLALSAIAESSYVCEVSESQQEESLVALVHSLDSSDSGIWNLEQTCLFQTEPVDTEHVHDDTWQNI